MWCCWISLDHNPASTQRSLRSEYQPCLGGLPCRRIGSGTVRWDAVGWDEPGIDDGEVGGDDGEEEEEEADDFGNVEGVVGLENEGEDDQSDDGEADDDAGYSLGPGFAIAGKHLGFLSTCLI